MADTDLQDGCLPLGLSYAIGQAVLHQQIPADPKDSTLPDPSYIHLFYDALNGYSIDRSSWSTADLQSELYGFTYPADKSVNTNGLIIQPGGVNSYNGLGTWIPEVQPDGSGWPEFTGTDGFLKYGNYTLLPMGGVDFNGNPIKPIQLPLVTGYALDDIRHLYAGYLRNGVIPADFIITDSSQFTKDSSQNSIWSDGDQVSKEKHIYFYGDTDFHDVPTGAGLGYQGYEGQSTPWWMNCALFVQIQGYSEKQGKWILPSQMNETVSVWRNDGGGKWTTIFSPSEWFIENRQAIEATYIAIFGTVLSIATAGAAAALAVALAISIAAATAICTAIAGMAIWAIKAVMTGDSTGMMDQIVTIGNASLQLTEQELGNLADQFPQAGETMKDINETIAQVKNQINNNPTLQAIKNQIDTTGQLIDSDLAEFKQYINAASNLVPGTGGTSGVPQLKGFQLFPNINQNYWNKATDMAGGIGTTGYYFMLQTKLANSVDDLTNVFTNAPDYAKDYVKFGSTIKSAEIEKVANTNQPYPPDAIFKVGTQVKTSRPGGGIPGSSFSNFVPTEGYSIPSPASFSMVTPKTTN